MFSEGLLPPSTQSLAPLVEHSDLLAFRGSELVVIDKIPTPTIEHEIPNPKELIRNVLATVAVRHFWSGFHDVHHAAWPDANYRDINRQTDSLVGSRYRGAAALKIRMPRQLH